MNRVILMGRLVRDPEIRYTSGERSMAVARYTLAVDRRGRARGKDNEPAADFINIVAFDKAGEFVEKYFRQGLRVLVSGRIQTGVTPIRTDKKSTPRMLSQRIRSLRTARVLQAETAVDSRAVDHLMRLGTAL